ncbi:hypothetical protein [Soonwooa sp.]|uniref:hypothetical protein n=1 Tax=Soonwooa sp. TaxID=1938592 RepID=UPI00261F85AF|nr:hypothetical protein [Soonwooa sp.]
MSTYFPYKKLLIEKVYQKAKQNTHEISLNGIFNDLEISLREDYKISLTSKSLKTYKQHFIDDNKDYNIPTNTLNDLSKYVGSMDFKDFCSKNEIEDNPSTKVEIKVNEDYCETHQISETKSNITINVINKPFFGIPEFMTKHSSMGIFGVLFILGSAFGGYQFFKPKQNTSTIQNLISATVSGCMYWNGDEYLQEDCDKINDKVNLIPLNQEKLEHFKRITNPDTLTLHSVGKVWYSKYNNEVTFFTTQGKNPENGKTLKPVTEYILNKYTQ